MANCSCSLLIIVMFKENCSVSTFSEIKCSHYQNLYPYIFFLNVCSVDIYVLIFIEPGNSSTDFYLY